MNSQGSSGVGSGGNDSKPERRSSAASSVSGNGERTDDEKAALLKKIKDDIIAREKEAAELEKSLGPKRKTDYYGNEPDTKKVKADG